MLVRQDVWDALDGFDPALPMFRDDLDFCWRAHRAGYRVLLATDAVVHHREAGYHGRRRLSIDPPRPHEADRAAALHVLLTQSSTWRLPLTTVRLVLGSLLRTLGFLLGKDVGDARDELAAVVSVLAHPGRVRASRARARATAVQPRSQTRTLRPRPGSQLRQALEALGGVITSGRGTGGTPGNPGGPGSALGAMETGPVDDDALYLDDTNPGWLRRTLVRPGVLLTVVLVVLAVVATRSLWWGSGALLGGALLPSPAGAADLWRTYTEAWHEVGPGSATPAPPYLAVLAALSTLLLGKAPVAVQVVLLLVVPLAGMSAFAALRGVVRSAPVRFWAAGTYALLPAVTGAVAAGRLGTAALAVVLPPLVRFAVRCAGLGGASLRPGTARTAWFGALLLAVATAFAPVVWVLAVLLAGVAAVTVSRDSGARRRLAALVAVPVLLLLPWSAYLAAHPVLLLLEPGLAGTGLTDPDLMPLDVLLLHPGGPGMTPVWLMVGVVAVGAAALLRRDRLRVALGAWVVALLALLVGTVQAVVTVTPPDAQSPLRTWPGPATLVLGLALVTAAAASADGLRARVRGASFGWRQPTAAVVILAAVFAPVLSAVWWVPGAGDPLRRGDTTTVPAFVAADSVGQDRPRTLVLRREAGGRIVYALVDGPGPRLGDADVPPPAAAWDLLDPVVAALASGLAGGEVEQLAGYAVRFVQLADPSLEGLVRTLDSEPGLRRLSSAGGEALWRVAGVTSRVRQVGPGGAATAVPATPEDVGDPLVDTDLDAGPAGRSLVLAESADPGWRARADGVDLAPAPAPDSAAWAQAFALPAEPVALVAGYDATTRSRWLWLQLAVVVVVVVLALPARREEDPDPDVDESGQPEAAEPEAVELEAAGLEGPEARTEPSDAAPAAARDGEVTA